MILETPSVLAKRNILMKKYSQAGIVFGIMNTLYLAVFFHFIPSFHFDFSAFISVLIYLGLIGVLSYFVYKGKKSLTIFLAVLFVCRCLFSTYQIFTGNAFGAVPYVLPLLVLTFYSLGRAAWDWP